MTNYEIGFLTKCAEYGIGIEESMSLLKSSAGKMGVVDKAIQTVARKSGPAREKALAFLQGKGIKHVTRKVGGRTVDGFVVPKIPAPPKRVMPK